MFKFLDIAPASTTSNGIGGTDLTIAIIGVAVVLVIGIVALVMSKGKNGK
jgi:hypothetical protein